VGERFLKALLAVLAGNAIYFLVLAPLLPPAARHQPLQLDLGLVVDFGVCLAVYGMVEWVARRSRARRRGRGC
jgi:H+/gluconate symporter-like permease